MKNSSPLRILAAATILCAASLATSSCSSYPSPSRASAQVKQSTGRVFSYNDQAVPAARAIDEVGALPERAARALRMWLAKSERKQVSYAYPQYFVEMVDNRSGRAHVWSLISDGRGNLVGVLIPKGSTPAWNLPNTGAYELYVCQGSQRDSLSRAIMNTLADAGYDEPRLSTRRALGLTEERYLVSKPAAVTEVAAPEPAAATATASDDKAPAAENKKEAEDDFGGDDFGADLEDDFGADSSDSDDSSDSSDDSFDDDFGDDDFGF